MEQQPLYTLPLPLYTLPEVPKKKRCLHLEELTRKKSDVRIWSVGRNLHSHVKCKATDPSLCCTQHKKVG